MRWARGVSALAFGGRAARNRSAGSACRTNLRAARRAYRPAWRGHGLVGRGHADPAWDRAIARTLSQNRGSRPVRAYRNGPAGRAQSLYLRGRRALWALLRARSVVAD